MKNIIPYILAMCLALPVFAQTVELEHVTDAEPGTITVDLNIFNFQNVGAITLYFAYDHDLLTYTGDTQIPFEGAFAGINAASGPEQWFSISWYNAFQGVDIDGTFLTLEFSYSGGFESALEFTGGGTEIATLFGEVLATLDTPGVFHDGSITPNTGNPDGILQIGDETAIAGTSVSLPLSILDNGGFSGQLAAVDLAIEYDTGQLSFEGVSDNKVGLIAGHDPGLITLSKESTTPMDLDLTDPAVKLNFTWLGGGDAQVNFKPGSFVLDQVGNVLTARFEHGMVMADPDQPPAGSLEIAQVMSPGATEYGGDPVSVPIMADGLSNEDVGNITLKVSYDHEKLIYTHYTPGLAGGGWNVSDTGKELTFTRADASGITIADGDLLTLHFSYLYLPDPMNPNDQADIKFMGGTLMHDTNGDPIVLTLIDGYVGAFINTNLNLILAGAYNASKGGMTTYLLDAGLIPLTQPYHQGPWNYGGNEQVAAIPSQVVDWVLVELRDQHDVKSTVAKRAGFLLSNGSITDLDGVTPLKFGPGVPLDAYYIVVRHRNHIDVISAYAHPFHQNRSGGYDFTNPANGNADNGMICLGNGLYGLYPGDTTSNGEVTIEDRGNLIQEIGAENSYLNEDINLSGNVSISDRSVLFNSFGGSNTIP